MFDSQQDPRTTRARTRRMLEDTALVASGGGVLTALEPDPALCDIWHARVTRGDRASLALRLDRRLGTAEVAQLDDARVLQAA